MSVCSHRRVQPVAPAMTMGQADELTRHGAFLPRELLEDELSYPPAVLDAAGVPPRMKWGRRCVDCGADL